MKSRSQERIDIAPHAQRAFISRFNREPGSHGCTIQALTFAEPTTELSAPHACRGVRHLAVIDDVVWIVTSAGSVERRTLDLTPLDAFVVSWRYMDASSGDGRRILIKPGGLQSNADYRPVAVLDLPSNDQWDLQFGMRYDSANTESDVTALDAAGERVIYSLYGRYSGRSTLEWRGRGAPSPGENEVDLEIEEEIDQLVLAPRGAHAVALLDGEQVVVFPVPWCDDRSQFETPAADTKSIGELLADDGSARYAMPLDEVAGAWRRSSPGSLLASFLDDERVVLVGRERAFVCSVIDGTELRAVELPAGTPVAVDGVRRVLWMRTATGFRAVPL